MIFLMDLEATADSMTHARYSRPRPRSMTFFMDLEHAMEPGHFHEKRIHGRGSHRFEGHGYKPISIDNVVSVNHGM